MKVVLPKINFTEVLRLMSVTYTAVVPVEEATVEFVTGLLEAERRRRGTRWRALTCMAQAVLALRWFIDGTRISQLMIDNEIGKSTCYSYLHEVIDVIAAQAPGLRNALLAAKAAGYEHVSVDGTLIGTDRVGEPGPSTRKAKGGTGKRKRVDLWWSGKHHRHGGNIQVVTAPDGWPLWTSPVRPGREHDTTALRTHPEMLPAFTAWTADQQRPVLGDLGYEGEAATITVAVKKPKGGTLTDDQKTANKAHNGKRSVGERGNSLLKTTLGPQHDHSARLDDGLEEP
jgi:hypothetical protein